MCVIWGRDDLVIPARHADDLRRHVPAARVHVLPGVGHFPHKDAPEATVDLIHRFIVETKPATYHRGRWRALLTNGAPAGPAHPDTRVVTIA